MNNIRSIREQIENGNFTTLPEEMAIGTVYQIPFYGSLDEDGIELGYLFLPKGSGIKYHQHTDGIERYKLLFGDLSVNLIDTTSNICLLGDFHNIDPVREDTIIQTCNVSKYALDMLENFSSKSFDQLVTKIREEKIYCLK